MKTYNVKTWCKRIGFREPTFSEATVSADSRESAIRTALPGRSLYYLRQVGSFPGASRWLAHGNGEWRIHVRIIAPNRCD